MLTSHKNELVFVHIPKTGGTSLKYAFRAAAKMPYVLGTAEVKLEPTAVKPKIFHEGKRVRQHMTRNEICKAWPELSDYEFFGMVRNPFDLHVSNYEFIRARWNHHLHDKMKTFDDYIAMLKSGSSPDNQRTYLEYLSAGKLDDFFYGKFENIRSAFECLQQRLNSLGTSLPHYKANPHKQYTEYYDDAAKKVVAAQHAKDLEYFNYEFGA